MNKESIKFEEFIVSFFLEFNSVKIRILGAIKSAMQFIADFIWAMLFPIWILFSLSHYCETDSMPKNMKEVVYYPSEENRWIPVLCYGFGVIVIVVIAFALTQCIDIWWIILTAFVVYMTRILILMSKKAKQINAKLFVANENN